jgi:proteic killer suppression protein
MCSGAIRKPAIAALIIWIVVVEWVRHFSLSLRLQYPARYLPKETKYVTVSLRGRGLPLIQSFRDRWLREFYLKDKTSKKIPAEVQDRLFRKLQLIDDATCDLDLRSPPSNHFEKLRGNLAGKHSIRVNKQWRLVFTWSGERGEAQDIYLDNHDYR